MNATFLLQSVKTTELVKTLSGVLIVNVCKILLENFAKNKNNKISELKRQMLLMEEVMMLRWRLVFLSDVPSCY